MKEILEHEGASVTVITITHHQEKTSANMTIMLKCSGVFISAALHEVKLFTEGGNLPYSTDNHFTNVHATITNWLNISLLTFVLRRQSEINLNGD